MPEMSKGCVMKKYKWTVEIEVDETWVEDGFDLTDERARNMIGNSLPYAYGHEFKARVLTRPNMAEVNIAQGAPADRQREGWPVVERGDVVRKEKTP